MVVGKERESAHTWGQDGHPSSSRTALPHTVADQDHSLVLATGQQSQLGLGFLRVFCQSGDQLSCLRCLSAFTVLLSTLTALSASSFMLQRPKWISSIYDLSLSPHPCLSVVPLWLSLILGLQHCCKALPVFYRAAVTIPSQGRTPIASRLDLEEPHRLRLAGTTGGEGTSEDGVNDEVRLGGWREGAVGGNRIDVLRKLRKNRSRDG